MNQLEKKFGNEALKNGFNLFKDGWPDFLLEKDGRVILVGVKKGGQRLTEKQAGVKEILEQVGLPYFISIDGDWPIGNAQGYNYREPPYLRALKNLGQSFRLLTKKEREVIRLRWGLKGESLTLKQVGKKLRLSPEAIRKIEAKALSEIRFYYSAFKEK